MLQDGTVRVKITVNENHGGVKPGSINHLTPGAYPALRLACAPVAIRGWTLPGKGPRIKGVLGFTTLQGRIDHCIEGRSAAVFVASIGADQLSIFPLEQNFLTFRALFHRFPVYRISSGRKHPLVSDTRPFLVKLCQDPFQAVVVVQMKQSLCHCRKCQA
jgi:hypothetical protein